MGAAFDWNAVRREAADLLGQYLRVDTTNPPGNELASAEFLAQAMRDRGLEPRLYRSAPGRANVVARVKGTGRAGGAGAAAGIEGPVLLLHHMDVVPANRAAWSHDPFGGEVDEGYVYGRGALDMKGMGVMQLLAVERLLAAAGPPSRDIILMAVSDEECGGRFGTGYMVENHWDEIRPAVVWDEGGFGMTGVIGQAPVFYVAVAEKQVLWCRLVATGEAGLASIPRGANPIDALARAIDRLGRHPFPPRLNGVTSAMLRRLAPAAGFPLSFILRNVANPLVWPLARRALTAQPTLNAALRNLVTVTELRAGDKQNVIPARAEASLDIRLLPGEDAAAFVRELEDVIADDRVRVEVQDYPPPSIVSPYDDKAGFFAALAAQVRAAVPGAAVVPMQTPGGTDSLYFRNRGVPAYGLIPVLFDAPELDRMHGVDERLSLDNLVLGTRIIHGLLAQLAE